MDKKAVGIAIHASFSVCFGVFILYAEDMNKTYAISGYIREGDVASVEPTPPIGKSEPLKTLQNGKIEYVLGCRSYWYRREWLEKYMEDKTRGPRCPDNGNTKDTGSMTTPETLDVTTPIGMKTPMEPIERERRAECFKSKTNDPLSKPVETSSPSLENQQLLTLAKIAERDLPSEFACSLAARDITLETRDNYIGPGWAGVKRSGRHFTFDRHCPGETIWPVWRDGILRDLAAWNGKTWATLCGREVILGFDLLINWSDHLRPLRIFKNPMDWLVSRCAGVVILDDDAAWRIVERFNHFQADNLEYGEQLEIMLQRPARHFTIHIPAEEDNDA